MKDSRFSEVYQINDYPSRILLSVNAVSSVHGMSTSTYLSDGAIFSVTYPVPSR